LIRALFYDILLPEDVVDRIKRLVDKLLEEQEKVEPVQPKKSARQLIELICSGNYLLIGGQALKAYLEPRFTKDLDFLVDKEPWMW
jgi:hypothetical protein